MKKRNRYAYLLVFARGARWSEVFKGRSWKFLWRMIRRHPATVYWLMSAATVRWVTRTEHIHVLVGNHQVLLDSQFQGPQFLAYEDAIKNYRGLNGWCVFLSDNEIDLSQFERPPMGWLKKKWNYLYAYWGRWLMWATRGLYQCDNCTLVARKTLRAAGIDIPRRCWNPALVLIWMTENGYAFTPGAPPSAYGPAD